MFIVNMGKVFKNGPSKRLFSQICKGCFPQVLYCPFLNTLSYIQVSNSLPKKRALLKISQNSQEKTCVGVSFLINFIKKETPTQIFSCEFCEIFKNALFL